MYKLHNYDRELVNKYKTAVNPRIHMDDFLGLPQFDMVFTWNTPKELYLTGRDAYADRCLTADRRKGEQATYDLALTVDGVKRRAYNLQYNPPKRFVVDHIRSNPHDIRPVNLRLATQQQNIWNCEKMNQGEVLQHENGLYFVSFPRVPEASERLYEHREDTEAYLYELQDLHFGEYGYRRSQEIADKYDTHLFDEIFMPLFSPADRELIHEIEEMPYYFATKDGYFINKAKVELRKLNAEYMYLYQQATKALNADLTHADAEQRTEICRVLSWLEDGRYIVNLGHFIGRINEVICMHLEYKNHCARQA